MKYTRDVIWRMRLWGLIKRMSEVQQSQFRIFLIQTVLWHAEGSGVWLEDDYKEVLRAARAFVAVDSASDAEDALATAAQIVDRLISDEIYRQAGHFYLEFGDYLYQYVYHPSHDLVEVMRQQALAGAAWRAHRAVWSMISTKNPLADSSIAIEVFRQQVKAALAILRGKQPPSFELEDRT